MSSGRQVAIYWGVVALLCLALSPWAPELAGGLPACPVKTTLGLPCPGCGATRATLALASLSLGEALVANPLVTLAWIGLLAGGLGALALALGNRPLPTLPRRMPWSFRIALPTLVAINWLYLVGVGI